MTLSRMFWKRMHMCLTFRAWFNRCVSMLMIGGYTTWCWLYLLACRRIVVWIVEMFVHCEQKWIAQHFCIPLRHCWTTSLKFLFTMRGPCSEFFSHSALFSCGKSTLKCAISCSLFLVGTLRMWTVTMRTKILLYHLTDCTMCKLLESNILLRAITKLLAMKSQHIKGIVKSHSCLHYIVTVLRCK